VQHEQTCPLAAAGESVEQVDRRGVAPVRVLEHERERRAAADLVERLSSSRTIRSWVASVSRR
jgi:hypothetical protein